MDKRERLITAYNYLKNKGVVHTQRNLAERLRTNEANISKALKGVEGVLTDGFLKRFNRAYGDIFNTEWLLTGEGDMLAATVQQTNVQGSSNIIGDNNHHNNNTTTNTTTTDKLLNIVTQSQQLAAQSQQLVTQSQEQVAMAQEHIARLLTIIEEMQRNR